MYLLVMINGCGRRFYLLFGDPVLNPPHTRTEICWQVRGRIELKISVFKNLLVKIHVNIVHKKVNINFRVLCMTIGVVLNKVCIQINKSNIFILAISFSVEVD